MERLTNHDANNEQQSDDSQEKFHYFSETVYIYCYIGASESVFKYFVSEALHQCFRVFIFIERKFIMYNVYYYLLENKTCNLFETHCPSLL